MARWAIKFTSTFPLWVRIRLWFVDEIREDECDGLWIIVKYLDGKRWLIGVK